MKGTVKWFNNQKGYVGSLRTLSSVNYIELNLCALI